MFHKASIAASKTEDIPPPNLSFSPKKVERKDGGFPEHFFWGAATSAHQVEGGNRNDWSEWEQSPTRAADLKKRGLDPAQFISDRACDHFHRFKDDFDIAKQLGHNAHRFSIEWSRIEPEEGKFDEWAIEHYHKVVRALLERGMEPFMTLWHWTLPLWVRDAGGWENKQTVDWFVRFCAKMADEFKGDVRYMMIFNEPEYWLSHTYLVGNFPPGRRVSLRAPGAFLRMVRVHRRAYAAIKKIDSDFQVGIVQSTGWIEPAPVRILFNYLRNFLFPSLVDGYFDFFGLNYYRSIDLWGNTKKQQSEIGWDIYPEGLYRLARQAYRRFKKPIIITENGIADSTDTKRAAYIRDHIAQVERALKDGIDIRGYFYWSLLDNFEWDSGFGPRFGLVEMDYKTMERKIRKSAWEYKRLIGQ